MNICRLVYMSERKTGAPLDIAQLVYQSRQKNARAGVTGFLMCDGGYFVQALEGTRSAVTQTYNRIAADPRHHNLYLVSCMDVRERLFPDWSMGVVDGVPSEAREKFLATFTIERLNPNCITIEKLLHFLLALAAETRAVERKSAIASVAAYQQVSQPIRWAEAVARA